MKVLNAFTLNAVPAELQGEREMKVSFRPCSAEEAGRLLAEKGVESYIGHEDTARIFSAQTGHDIPAMRRMASLQFGEEFLVGQYLGPRLPEGSTQLPEGARIQWYRVCID